MIKRICFSVLMAIAVVLLCGNPASADRFQGRWLTIKIDGKPTQHGGGRDLGNCVVWKVDGKEFWQTSGNPEIFIDYDKSKLGTKGVHDINVNPIKKDGSRDYANVITTKDPARDGFPTGKAVKIKKWDALMTELDSLPPGRYWLQISTNGNDMWDRQCIAIEVVESDKKAEAKSGGCNLYSRD